MVARELGERGEIAGEEKVGGVPCVWFGGDVEEKDELSVSQAMGGLCKR
jgi:hypothetical protein